MVEQQLSAMISISLDGDKNKDDDEMLDLDAELLQN